VQKFHSQHIKRIPERSNPAMTPDTRIMPK